MSEEGVDGREDRFDGENKRVNDGGDGVEDGGEGVGHFWSEVYSELGGWMGVGREGGGGRVRKGKWFWFGDVFERMTREGRGRVSLGLESGKFILGPSPWLQRSTKSYRKRFEAETEMGRRHESEKEGESVNKQTKKELRPTRSSLSPPVAL